MASALLASLIERGFQFWIRDGQLRYNAPKGAVTPEVREALIEHKAELLQLVGADRKLACATPAQERLLFLDRLASGTPLYNLSEGVCRLRGPIDSALLQRCLEDIHRRHEPLRTVFAEIDGRPVQVIRDNDPLDFQRVDLASFSEETREAEARRLAAEALRAPFDLKRGPLFRAVLYALGAEDHLLALPMHHSVFDGWSMGVLLRELAALYSAGVKGLPSPLPGLDFHYADYARWQRAQISEAFLERELAFWRDYLPPDPDPVELPVDHARPATQSYEGASEFVSLPRDLTAHLHALSRAEGATLYMTLLAAFAATLHRYTGQVDLVVGAAAAGRNHPRAEALAGFFINTLPLRAQVFGNDSFQTLLHRVRESALQAYAHQEVPFDKIVEAVQPRRDLSRNPLVQVMFVLDNVPIPALEIAGCRIERETIDTRIAPVDLGFTIVELDGALHITVEYKTSLFERDTVAQFLDHYRHILERVVREPGVAVAAVPLHATGEPKPCLGARPCRTFTPVPPSKIETSIAARFEEIVAAHGDCIAVKSPQESWTYARLNAAANGVARTLLERSGPGGERVGLYFNKGPEMLAAILGVLKSGKTYVPLDPVYPEKRLAYMVEDAEVRAVVAGTPVAFLPETCAAIPFEETQAFATDTNVAGLAGPDTLAYILYTSGSTGQPKGVVQNHRNALYYNRAYTNDLAIDCHDRLTWFASFGFDAAVVDILGALLNGAVLYPVDLRDASPTEVAEWIEREAITIYHSTPSMYRAFLDALPDAFAFNRVEAVVLGGEATRSDDFDLFRKRFTPAAIFMNLMGQTECSYTMRAFLHHGDISPRSAPSLGTPVEGTEIVLVDEHGTPDQVVGEMQIQSPHVAIEYWRRPDLTAEAFSTVSGSRAFRTGDKARRLPDGTLLFHGRKDFQVKVRGYRIELGEIETALKSHAGVREALVLALVPEEDTKAEPQLVAYVAADAHADLAKTLQQHLRSTLPDYMVPSHVVCLDRLPLTPHGKVDRRALPRPGMARAATVEGRAPRTPVEEILAGIWRQLLRLDRVGATDSFFDLGGHSLLATQVVSRVRDACGVDLPLRVLFESPTIEHLAECVERAQQEAKGAPPPIVPVARDGRPLPVSFAQQRLWFVDQLMPGNVAYNLMGMLRLKGALDISALTAALSELVRRHETLRTHFESIDGTPFQVIDPPQPFALERADLTTLPESEREAEVRRWARRETERPFNLAQGPIVRATLVQVRDDEYVLIFGTHHIASDGWSMGVLVREITKLYPAFLAGNPSPLPPLRIQYADFASWQRAWLSEEALEAQLQYWRERLADMPTLALPADRPRQPLQQFRGGTERFTLPIETANALNTLSRKHGVTLFMTLLAAFKVLLYRWTGQTDIATGSPIANRNRADIEPLIGFFVNTLVLRTDLSGNPAFAEVLQRVREMALGAYAHQDTPFEKLVEALAPERDLSRNPLFETMFVFQNMPREPFNLPGLTITPETIDQGAAKVDLNIHMEETAEGLVGNVEYNADLFEPDTIRQWMAHFANLIEAVLADPRARIGALPILTERERAGGEPAALMARPGKAFVPVPPCAIKQTIAARFEAVTARHSERAAVKTRAEMWTYAALNAAANGVARALLDRCAPDDERIGLYFKKGPAMLAAILGALKAGKAYVPLDPVYPEKRLAYIADDARIRVIVADDPMPFVSADRVVVSFADTQVHASATNVSGAAVPDSIAYIMYTSGSTGQPKGVVQNHRNVLHYNRVYTNDLAIDAEDRLTLFASFGFDAAVVDIFAALLSGAMLYPVDLREESPAEVAAWLDDERITIYHSTPSTYRAFVNALPDAFTLPHVDVVVLGGEETRADDLTLCQTRFGPQTVLMNLMGQTECSYTMRSFLRAGDVVRHSAPPLGSPLDETEVLLVNDDGEAGQVFGEITIRSPHLALEYWNLPELTDAAFSRSQDSARMFRTGDLARRLPDGSLLFQGRKDFQVKVRGYRIELGEIESALKAYPGVKEALVLAAAPPEDPSADKRLVAYVVADASEDISDSLRRRLQGDLPEYMVPSFFVALERFPLTPNGKLDRRALPVPSLSRSAFAEGFIAPRTPVEELLATIWREVLHIDRVGVSDRFFDLGGHSLLLTQVVSRVRDAFHVDVPLRSLFESPTIEQLARTLESKRAERRDQTPPLDPMPRTPNTTFPLSFAQQRLWIIHQLEPDSTAYHIPVAVRLTGPLDVAALEASLREVVHRHEVLRSTFEVVDGRPVQAPHEARPFNVRVVDLSDKSDASDTSDVAIRRAAAEEAQRSFDLSRGPLLRATLFRIDADNHVAVFVMHHIVSDGWSLNVLIEEVAALYLAHREGRPSPLPPLRVQYGDFAVWQRAWLQGGVLDEQIAYWREQLTDLAPLELPTDRPRPPIRRSSGARFRHPLSVDLSTRLRALSQREHATLFMTLFAAFATLLHRYSGAEDIAIGSPIANRRHADIERLIGFFVNTLVMRPRPQSSMTFRELLRAVRQTALDAYDRQDVPFEQLVETLQPERDMGRNPLFDVMFVLQNAPGGELALPDLTIARQDFDTHTAQFDLSLAVIESGQGLECRFSYSTDLFDASTIERMATHYATLLEGIAADPACRIGDLSLMTEAERHRILVEWNATDAVYPGAPCLHQLFEEQVRRTPDAVALVFEGASMTYRELDARANRLASYLQRNGVAPDTFVGVCMVRSFEMVIALYGILKAGGAYVPLDPSYPKDRLAFMLKDTQARVILAQSATAGELPEHEAHVLRLDSEWDKVADESAESPNTPVGAANLAYVIYTSGSTGVPKGVMIEHGAIRNCILWMQSACPLMPDDRFLQKTPFHFDVSVLEFFWPLAVGATLVVARPEGHRDSAYLVDVIARERITAMEFVPSMLHIFLSEPGLERCRTLRSVTCAGEALSADLVKRFAAAFDATMYNMYGPTETAVIVTSWTCRQDESLHCVPIGRPLGNTRAYIVDASLNPVPIGVPGELLIGGVQLARGYLNRPELTAEKFILDPFSPDPRARMYRTGDLVRFLPNGDIEFLGRIDQQVKIRGFRVELGEIEATLRQHASVHDAVVTCHEDALRNKRLIACFVPEEGSEIAPKDLRVFVQDRLPDYMVPAIYVPMDALPLLPSGKVNRRALPVPEMPRAETSGECVAPRTPIESALVEVWSALLGTSEIGVTHNFFDLGGHSLLATQVISRIRETFRVDIPLRVMFESPTIERLAQHVETAQTEGRVQAPPITPVDRGQPLPLSFAQQRLWVVDQLVPGSSAYNISAALRMQGRLDTGALERTLAEIVRRHEILRTRFDTEGEHPVQIPNQEQSFALRVVDLSDLSDLSDRSDRSDDPVQRAAEEEAQRPFDLRTGPLVRATLIRLSDSDHVLLFTMHHIVSDGWSLGILVEEIKAIYAAHSEGRPSPLPEMPIQYADFAAWQRAWLRGAVLERQLGYWTSRLADAPMLELPTDHPRPPVQRFVGAAERLRLPHELVAALGALSQREGATLFMTLLAAFNVVLHRYTGQDGILVGSPIANRNRAETEGLIGFFVNTLALYTDLGGDPSFPELLRRVRETALGAYDHQDVPFEKLVDALHLERDMSRNPLVQVVFALQNAPLGQLEILGLRAMPLERVSRTTHFDLELLATEEAGGVACVAAYSTDLFEAETIRRMLGHWRAVLEGIAADPLRPISEIPMLSDAERLTILVEWNATTTDYPRESAIHALFEAQAAATPDMAAVVCGEQRLTYRALNERANRLARRLRDLGTGRESLIGLCMERSLDMIVATLAILKAGGAYLPIDPAYPKARLAYMLDDAQAPVVIVQRSLMEALPETSAAVIVLDEAWPELERIDGGNLSSDTRATDLAYVMYTSGSTGTPKGVCVTHRNVVRLVRNTQYAHFGPDEVFLQFAPISFDAATLEIWGPLLNGGRLAVYPPEMPSLDDLGAAIQHYCVTTLWLTSGLFHQMVEHQLESLRGVRQLLSGGDVLSVPHCRRVLESLPETTLINGYGPTECTTFTCCYPMTSTRDLEATVPIGRPIANARTYILDPHLNLAPIGAPGELYIGGDGVARGYLNSPDLTEKRFIRDPFSDDPEARLYKTGDRVRYLQDGRIEFLGRIDFQVKLRGFRIELGEIEAAIKTFEGVVETLVLVHESAAAGKRLVAYVAAQPRPEASALRAYLQDRLPGYMVPGAFVFLDAFPLTPNGKIDRRALPEPDVSGEAKTHVPPETEEQRRLVAIWEDLLNVKPIGIDDDFFELGGHSMLAMTLVHRIEKTMSVKLPLTALFQATTVRRLAEALTESHPLQTFTPVVPLQTNGTRPPFFCVPGIRGEVLSLRPFSELLGSDQPFYALQFDDREGPPLTIEEMAAQFVEHIRAIQPQGPYHLGGLCFGGVLAYEIAQQLTASGAEVAVVALFEAYAPAGRLTLLERLQRLFIMLAVGRPRTTLHYLKVRLREYKKIVVERSFMAIVPRNVMTRVAFKYRQREDRRQRATVMKSYVAKPYAGRLCVFRAAEASEHYYRQYRDTINGWKPLCSQEIETHAFACGHGDLMREPYIAEVASRLRDLLDRYFR